MMGREFVSATMNNKGTFLPQCWISKVHCHFTVIFLPLYALRVVVDFVIFVFACRDFVDLLVVVFDKEYTMLSITPITAMSLITEFFNSPY